VVEIDIGAEAPGRAADDREHHRQAVLRRPHHRVRVDGQRVFPTVETPLRTWIGVGGSPNSVVRAAQYGLPMMLAIIGGAPGKSSRACASVSAT
jgi:alkanesulfonate monooxygenase SsuD/methylene tetrahydromethanopterin reductase-like flavin-dependent oxidoreductase (luciferase family)